MKTTKLQTRPKQGGHPVYHPEVAAKQLHHLHRDSLAGSVRLHLQRHHQKAEPGCAAFDKTPRPTGQPNRMVIDGNSTSKQRKGVVLRERFMQ